MRRRPEPLTPTGIISRQASELRASYTAQEAARTPAGDPVRWVGRMFVEVIHKADRDRLLGLAAETAFFAVLTLFPALLVVAAVLGQLRVLIGSDNALRVEKGVLDFLDAVLTDAASPAVRTVRDLFESSGGALTLASLLALFSLSTAFATLVNTVNIAYDVPETRGWWRRRFLGLLLGTGTVLIGALAVTLLVIGPLFGAEEVVTNIGFEAEYAVVWSYLRWPTAFLALVVWATTMDHFAPATRSRWREDLPGGLLTAALWLGASYGLNLYVSTVVTSSPVFGALGGGLILMSWFYLLCVALLAGAELNAILLARRRHRAAVAAHTRSDGAEAGGGGGGAGGREGGPGRDGEADGSQAYGSQVDGAPVAGAPVAGAPVGGAGVGAPAVTSARRSAARQTVRAEAAADAADSASGGSTTGGAVPVDGTRALVDLDEVGARAEPRAASTVRLDGRDGHTVPAVVRLDDLAAEPRSAEPGLARRGVSG